MKFTSIWRRNSSAASSSTGPATAMPALLTRPASVSPPSAARTSPAAARTAASSVTSNISGVKLAPNSPFRRSASACLRTLPKTRKPRSSSSFAQAQPMPVDAPVMTTDLMWVQALVRGLMKFVVKEFLSARLAGLPGGQPAKPDRSWPDSFPFEFSWQRFGEDSRRTDISKATEKCPFRFKTCHFLRFVASDGARRATAGQKITEARGAPFGARFIACTSRDDDGTISFCCRGRFLQLQVVVPALTRT